MLLGGGHIASIKLLEKNEVQINPLWAPTWESCDPQHAADSVKRAAQNGEDTPEEHVCDNFFLFGSVATKTLNRFHAVFVDTRAKASRVDRGA